MTKADLSLLVRRVDTMENKDTLTFAVRSLLHRAQDHLACLLMFLPASLSPSLAAALQAASLSVGGRAPAVFNEP